MAARQGLSIASTIKLNSGHAIPQLGFGAGDIDDVVAACKIAFSLGYRHVDTARFYGSEEAVAKAVKISGVPRSDFFLTTKVKSEEHGYEACSSAVDSSYERLGGLWDLILLHDPTAGKEKRVEAYRALVDAQKAGKTRSIGVSSFGVKHLEELEAAGLPTPAVNQLELHPWNQQRPIVTYCLAHSITIEAFCPLARGRYLSDPTLVSISERYGKSPAQVLVRWSLQKGYVPLPKSEKRGRIEENCGVYDFELDDEAMRQLDVLDRGKEGSVSWNPVSAE